MPHKEIGEWVSLNILNAVYLVKDWIMLNVGIGVSALNTENAAIDIALKWGIGLSILVFNIVRIIKYIIDIKRKNNETK